ncbi:hypothetical protein [Psychromonas algicola]|uniref:hypothetical protein n=1 Tax=Psychromonas algicola TaxID=2555642 RepID=UPI0010686686|nr:hypothetical protein [Psychromonas sp. RZ5]TEW51675.1 hypothetical protein E2R67_06785 [Psychromonas sp. RZ5]
MQCFRPVGDFTFSWSEEKVSKKTDTESLSNPNNESLSDRTSSYGTSLCRMNLQQTSCLLLLKVIHRLGKLNGGDVVAALSKVLLPIEQLHSVFLHEKGFIFLFNSLI